MGSPAQFDPILMGYEVIWCVFGDHLPGACNSKTDGSLFLRPSASLCTGTMGSVIMQSGQAWLFLLPGQPRNVIQPQNVHANGHDGTDGLRVKGGPQTKDLCKVVWVILCNFCQQRNWEGHFIPIVQGILRGLAGMPKAPKRDTHCPNWVLKDGWASSPYPIFFSKGESDGTLLQDKFHIHISSFFCEQFYVSPKMKFKAILFSTNECI